MTSTETVLGRRVRDIGVARRRLSIGWKVMVAWGLFNTIFAVIVPVVSLFADPTIFTFGVDDAKFVGMSWTEIVGVSPNMGLWMVLMMVSMCAMMIGYGVLTTWVAWLPYRRGERWAWRSLFVSGAFLFLYQLVLVGYYVARGLYGMFTPAGAFPSGISVGVPFLVIWAIWFIVGLWLPRRGLEPQ